MTDKEVRRLKRKSLIEILFSQAEENERLIDENAELRRKLRDKEIRMENAGTIAEAAFAMNEVFESAQAAAQQYLDNVKVMTDHQENVIKVQCAQLEEDTRIRCEQRERETEDRCNALLRNAEREAEAKWQELSVRLEEFYQAHAGLKELLTVNGTIKR